MTRNERIFLEGFTAGLTCSGIGCDYKIGTDAYDKWWNAFRLAKKLGIRDEVQKQLLAYMPKEMAA